MSKPTQDEILLLERLREILLKEDREELERLRNSIEDPEQLSEKVMPFIEQRIDFLKNNFPKEFKIAVTDLVDKRLKASQSELLDTIYPVLGQMIKKYIAHQFQQLKDSIDKTVKESLDTKKIWWKIKASIFGIRESEMILNELNRATIEEVSLIQHHSGLLIGNASLNPTVDKEVIAGMLTAIKSFAEDAFHRDNEELEMIQYGSYKIMLFNFHTYYAAVALSGSVSNEDREKLNDRMHTFVIKELKNYSQKELDHKQEIISKKLEEYFITPQTQTQILQEVEFEPQNQVIAAL
jgi:predicted regulator of Ras-like GTPase activity (Roadblock/LC7/MglB family)